MSLDEIIGSSEPASCRLSERDICRALRKLVNRSARPRAKAVIVRRCRGQSRSLRQAARYKDEYEVARLIPTADSKKQLRDQFDGDFKDQLQSGAADPVARRRMRWAAEEARVGAWMLPVFRMLAKARVLRGTAFEFSAIAPTAAGARPDRGLRERRCDRAWPVVAGDGRHRGRMLSLARSHRGYGPVKEKAVMDAKARYAQLAPISPTPPPAPRQIAAE